MSKGGPEKKLFRGVLLKEVGSADWREGKFGGGGGGRGFLCLESSYEIKKATISKKSPPRRGIKKSLKKTRSGPGR